MKMQIEKTSKIIIALAAAILSTAVFAEEGKYVIESYEIKWGGHYDDEGNLYDHEPSGYTDQPGCCICFIDAMRKIWKESYGYAGDSILEYGKGVPYAIYRDDVEIATGTSEYGLDGSIWFDDYDVIPGNTYKYEIKVLGEDLERIYGSIKKPGFTFEEEYTSGPLYVECYFIHTVIFGSGIDEVSFDENGGERDVRVYIYKETSMSQTIEGRPNFWVEPDGDWFDARISNDSSRITVVTDENNTNSAREGILNVGYNGFVWPLKVKQAGKESNVTVATGDGDVTIPATWFSENCAAILAEHGGDFETTALADAANGMKVWECYVVGTDPMNPESRFAAIISLTNGMPYVTWSPNLNTNGIIRNYTVLGKANLADMADWAPTNSTHKFFKVKVEMP